MGDAERGVMFLDLEKTSRELNELVWKASEIGKSFEKLGHFLSEKAVEFQAGEKTYPHLKDLVNFDKITEITQKIAELNTKKKNLENKLGTKITTTQDKTTT